MKNNHHPGTRTFYLPLDRGPETPPEVTLLIGKDTTGYKVAHAICSRRDQFKKTKARAIVQSKYAEDYCLTNSSLLPIMATLSSRFEALNKRHPGTISALTMADLLKIPNIFNKKNNTENTN